jgi:glycosyltransferase involved in cell wall biosynthesis
MTKASAIRVLHVSPSYARKDGGPSEVLRGLIPALGAAGATVSVATTDKGTDESDGDFLDNNNVRTFRSAPPRSLNRSPELSVAIAEMIREVDVVHIHSIHTMISTVAMKNARILGVPYILQPHGALDAYHLNQGRLKKQLFSRLLDSSNLRHLSGVIYSSQREARFGKKFLPSVPDFEVALGVDSRLFDPSQRRSTNAARSVLFHVRVTEKKRIDLLIRAFSIAGVRQTGAKLVIAGPIDERLKYDPVKLAEELNLTGTVTFMGKVDANTRERLLAESSIFALPSEDESFGVAAAEAVAAGCPTLLSANVGIADELERVGGTRTTLLNAGAIAAGIVELFEHPKRTAAMAAIGMSLAKEKYTWTSAAAQTLDAYNQVLSPTDD